jgi:hypothetical protein
MIQLHPLVAPAVPSIPATPDFRVGGISSRYFNLQGIRDRLQVKTPSLEACAVLPVSLGFKRLARRLHACSQIVSRDCMERHRFACGNCRQQNKLRLEHPGFGLLRISATGGRSGE